MSTKLYNLLKVIAFCITVGVVIFVLSLQWNEGVKSSVKAGFEAGYIYGLDDCKGTGGFLPKGDNKDDTIAGSKELRERPSTDDS